MEQGDIIVGRYLTEGKETNKGERAKGFSNDRHFLGAVSQQERTGDAVENQGEPGYPNGLQGRHRYITCYPKQIIFLGGHQVGRRPGRNIRNELQGPARQDLQRITNDKPARGID